MQVAGEVVDPNWRGSFPRLSRSEYLAMIEKGRVAARELRAHVTTLVSAVSGRKRAQNMLRRCPVGTAARSLACCSDQHSQMQMRQSSEPETSSHAMELVS